MLSLQALRNVGCCYSLYETMCVVVIFLIFRMHVVLGWITDCLLFVCRCFCHIMYVIIIIIIMIASVTDCLLFIETQICSRSTGQFCEKKSSNLYSRLAMSLNRQYFGMRHVRWRASLDGVEIMSIGTVRNDNRERFRHNHRRVDLALDDNVTSKHTWTFVFILFAFVIKYSSEDLSSFRKQSLVAHIRVTRLSSNATRSDDHTLFPFSIVAWHDNSSGYFVLRGRNRWKLKSKMGDCFQDSYFEILKPILLNEKFNNHKHLKCNMCFQIPQSPIQTTCCYYMMCGSCLENVKEKNYPCPRCQMNDFRYHVDHTTIALVQDIIVRCQHRHKGCQWEGKIKTYLNHLCLQCRFFGDRSWIMSWTCVDLKENIAVVWLCQNCDWLMSCFQW